MFSASASSLYICNKVKEYKSLIDPKYFAANEFGVAAFVSKLTLSRISRAKLITSRIVLSASSNDLPVSGFSSQVPIVLTTV